MAFPDCGGCRHGRSGPNSTAICSEWWIASSPSRSATVDDADVAQLKWLKARLGENLRDAVIVNTGAHAYRRQDGIAVVPAALLGP